MCIPCSILLFGSLGGCQTQEPSFDPVQCFSELVTELSTDEMQGRGIGTEGLEKASIRIEERLKAAGLADAGVAYRQPFQATIGVSMGSDNTLKVGDQALTLGTDFVPLGFSSDGAFEGPIVFAGYGIVADELGWDDYEGLDVEGRIVLAMRYEPGESDPDSPFDGKRPSRYSDIRYKAMKARELGAAALVFVAPARETDEPDKLPPLKRAGPTSRAGLPVIQVTRAVADAWLAAAGTDLATVHAEIDEGHIPKEGAEPLSGTSMVLPGLSATGTAQIVPQQAEVRNVLAVLPGRGELAEEIVVVGAHYDHLGMGGEGSMEPDVEAIHNGADDNASGTAAMVCGVEALAHSDAMADDRRTVLAIAFTAEEIGLGGSSYYVDNPVLPLDKTVAMVNLDMIGRIRDDKLQTLGTDTAPEWPGVLTPAGEAHGLQLEMGGDGYGPSDHTSFYEKKIPVIHMFSGTHEEYHTPADDVETLNLEGGARVVGFLTDVLSTLATQPGGMTYVKSRSGPRMVGDSRSRGAYLGTIPDMSAMSSQEGGVELSDVRGDGPADRAGIRGGDIIVGMAGAEIQNLYDMTFVLRDHRPGETIEVVVLRDGERLTLKATLGSRGEGPKPEATENNPTEHTDFSVGSDAPAHGGTTPGAWAPTAGKAVPELLNDDERHLADLRQLTFGGENAEAYWAPDGRRLIFQRTPVRGESCDQQYTLDLTTGAVELVSSGKGRTTCGYFDYPDGDSVLYATTEASGEGCPAPPDHSAGYVWPVYDSFEIVRQPLGGEPTPLLSSAAYDAEATVCMVDGRVVFTSTRSGDLELYIADPDGGNVEQLTDTPGYDGGAFFNADCSALVWRASRPEGDALADHQRLLKQGLVRPSQLELFWMELDGGKVEQLTDNGAANFAPYPLPDSSGVLYSSNAGNDPREFDILLVRRGVDAGPDERITTTKGFDGFPMFSPDGAWLVFASNRATPEGESDTNLFIARWVP
ncbi:MAG TPA: M28 family peptidase [Deltaproteobacteria bacterium]|nr:M28 family peptidase [Deltaproteobacteria bacterium]